MVFRDGTGYGAGSTGTGCCKKYYYSVVFLNIFKNFRWSSIMGKMRMLSVGASVRNCSPCSQSLAHKTRVTICAVRVGCQCCRWGVCQSWLVGGGVLTKIPFYKAFHVHIIIIEATSSEKCRIIRGHEDNNVDTRWTPVEKNGQKLTALWSLWGAAILKLHNATDTIDNLAKYV